MAGHWHSRELGAIAKVGERGKEQGNDRWLSRSYAHHPPDHRGNHKGSDRRCAFLYSVAAVSTSHRDEENRRWNVWTVPLRSKVHRVVPEQEVHLGKGGAP